MGPRRRLLRRLRRGLAGWPVRVMARRRSGRLDVCAPLGQPILVPPGVFHPALTPSSPFLYRTALALLRPGSRVLDFGCGSGLGVVALARAGHEVSAIDIDPRAVEATQANLRLNGLSAVVSVGDQTSLETAGPWDAVLWNPPFYGPAKGPTVPAGFFDAPRGALEDFLAVVPAALEPGGACLLVLSDDAPMATRVRTSLPSHLAAEVVARTAWLDERLVVLRLGRVE